MENKVSIIIPSYNRKEVVSECLRSLCALSYNNYEIIVVDDASRDNTSEYINSNFKNVSIIKNDRRRGPAYCKNQGLLRSSGRFIWFLDSDSIILNPDCLSNMVKLLRQNQNVGCIGGELVKEGGKYLVRVDGYAESRKMAFDENTRENFNMVAVRSLMSCNLFTSKDLLLKAGGFDTNYFYMSEDTDICQRIHALGYDIVLDHQTLVLHNYSRVSRKSNFYLLYRNEMRCALKNKGITNGFFKEPLRIFCNTIYSAKHNRAAPEKHKIFRNRLYLGMSIITSFVFAYIWNALFLLKTRYMDPKTDYLKKTVI